MKRYALVLAVLVILSVAGIKTVQWFSVFVASAACINPGDLSSREAANACQYALDHERDADSH
jgi:hypothetical protein